MNIAENSGNETSGSQILHPGSRKLFCYWEALRAERPCPTREEFDLGEVHTFAPDLVILERDHIRGSFRFRLAGSQVCDLYKTNLTGMDVLAGWDSFEADVIHKHLIQSLTSFQPTLFRSRLTTDNRQQVAVEALLYYRLPLAHAQARVRAETAAPAARSVL